MPDNNALHIAAKEGDLVQVQSHVGNFDINAKGEEDRTALSIAAENGYAEVVKLFLTFNADVNIPDVSTFKMKSVHQIYISTIPLTSFYSLFPTNLGIYSYHPKPITFSGYLLPQLLLPLTHAIVLLFLTFSRVSHHLGTHTHPFRSYYPLSHCTCLDLITTMPSILATILHATSRESLC